MTGDQESLGPSAYLTAVLKGSLLILSGSCIKLPFDPANLCRHVDLQGNEFPFSRGVSFYEINDEGKIVGARDCVEPAFKPGASALQVTDNSLANPKICLVCRIL